MTFAIQFKLPGEAKVFEHPVDERPIIGDRFSIRHSNWDGLIEFEVMSVAIVIDLKSDSVHAPHIRRYYVGLKPLT